MAGVELPARVRPRRLGDRWQLDGQGDLAPVLGREVAGRNGDRTLGAILGAAGGALLGRAVNNGGSRCR